MLRSRFPFSIILLLAIMITSCGCSQPQVSVKAAMTGNSNPPVLLKVESLDRETVRLVFDKEIKVYQNSFDPFEAYSDGYGIVVNLPSELAPGKQIMLSGRVEDYDGNTSDFRTPVWGYNTELAGMLINEIATKDEPKTEILITADGNTAGAVLYNGIPSDHEGMAILPDLNVSKGDYLVVWWTESKSREYGNDIMADISLVGKGYSNNGIQTLAESPAEGAKVLDCIVYSNSSSTYSGFGNSATESRVKKAVSELWWNDMTKPVSSKSTTKLRTMSRYLNSPDTDSCDDWYVVKDSGATFGNANTSEAYIPK